MIYRKRSYQSAKAEKYTLKFLLWKEIQRRSDEKEISRTGSWTAVPMIHVHIHLINTYWTFADRMEHVFMFYSLINPSKMYAPRELGRMLYVLQTEHWTSKKESAAQSTCPEPGIRVCLPVSSYATCVYVLCWPASSRTEPHSALTKVALLRWPQLLTVASLTLLQWIEHFVSCTSLGLWLISYINTFLWTS